MRIFCVLFILLGLLPATSAEEIKVPLVGLGWQIAFEAPTLKKYSPDYHPDSVQFRGNAGRFNVSVFVEPPPKDVKGTTHADCRDFYWTQAKRNPVIVADTIKQTTHRNCEAVTYRSKGVIQGTSFVQDSVNCFFVHEGKWVDIHASIIEPTPDDSKQLSEFATHLAYGPLQAPKGGLQKITLEDLGTLSFTPPNGWLVGNLIKDDASLKSSIYTVSFMSPTDPNSTCLLSLSAPPRVPATLEDLRQAVENSTAPVVGASVEGKAVLRDLKLKQGLGVVASFTDASLVGKPITPGDAKSITSGLLVPKSNVLAVVTMFSDDAKGEDVKKMTQTLESLALD